MSTRYRAVVHKILEDGTEVEILRIEDGPWYVANSLTDCAKRLKKEPQMVPVFPGQQAINVDGNGRLVIGEAA